MQNGSKFIRLPPRNLRSSFQLQCDLLELRDAHAKLRTTNEKLRREKDRWERENRAQQRSRTKTDDEDRRVQTLLENVDSLMRILPEVFEKKNSSKYLGVPSKKVYFFEMNLFNGV